MTRGQHRSRAVSVVLLGGLLVGIGAAPARAEVGPTSGGAGQEKRQGLYYEQQWKPQRLFQSANAVFIPWAHAEFARVPSPSAVITGLASAPSGGDVVYALSDASGSSLMSAAMDGTGPRPKRLATAESVAGEDAWFHGPMSLSPDGRWLLTCVGANRHVALGSPSAEAQGAQAVEGELWLIDCAKLLPPRRLLGSISPASYAWAPSAKYAVCVAQARQSAERRVVLIEPEGGDTWEGAAGAGHAVWSIDQKVTVYQYGSELPSIALHGTHAAPAGVTVETRSLSGIAADALWSYDGRMGAWVERAEGRETIRLRGLSGPGRDVSPAAGARCLLGWSQDSELLAYLGRDGGVYVCVAQPNARELEDILAVLPEMAGQESIRSAHGFETRESPVKLQSPSAEAVATWVQTAVDFPDMAASGPCLIYAEGEPGKGYTLYALTFARYTTGGADDPRKLTSAQIDALFTRGNLAVVHQALEKYAQDHDGKLPPHETGPELAKDLEGYLDYRGALSSAHAQDEIRVRLLHPGASLNDLVTEARSMGEESQGVSLLEMQGDKDYLFVLYLDYRKYHLETVAPEMPIGR
jgi:hypothetical protein